jgi:c-di-GMP-binding flagellar brake protein YcgR
MDQKDQSGVWLTLQQNTEVVEERLRIINLIKQLVDAHALVTVGLPGQDLTFNSAIVDIDTDRDTLTLDELTPREGHERLKLTGHCSVFGRPKGVGVYFEVDISEFGEENGIAYYRAPLPSLAFYGQKRNHYRVHVGLGTQAAVQLGDVPQQALATGQLRDLSVGGLGAVFPLTAPLESGMQFAGCTLDLPGVGPIECELEIRFARRNEEQRHLIVGAEFINVTPRQQRAVQRSVYMLERDELRRRTDR